MYVIKRNGTREEVKFDSITDRNKEIIQTLKLNINPSKLSQLVIHGLADGMTTSEIDELSAENAYHLSQFDPEYDQLACYITINNLHKQTKEKFDDYLDTIKAENLISNNFYNFAKKYVNIIQNNIDYSRDYFYEYFGIKTLLRSYLLSKNGKKLERPQQMLFRSALSTWADYDYSNSVRPRIVKGDIDKAIKQYYLSSHHYFTPASPILFNSGVEFPQLASCYLAQLPNDLNKIYDKVKELANVSKRGGGVGIDLSLIQCRGSKVKATGGSASGIMFPIKLLEATAKYVNQGKRNGSFAIYLPPWHPEIIEFLELKLPEGDDEMRARGLFTALWNCDLFMERVEKDEIWSLFCPSKVHFNDCYGDKFRERFLQAEKDKLYTRQIKARDVWSAVITSQEKTGVPYHLNRDTINEFNNQKNIGIIKCSNLCVVGKTMILTKDGYYRIDSLKNKEVEVWNGDKWSKTIVKKTGVNQKLIKVMLSDGQSITCTDYHKFILADTKRRSKPLPIKDLERIEAKDLKNGMKLTKFMLEPIQGNKDYDIKYPYTHGLFCADGTYNNKKPLIALYKPKHILFSHIDVRTTSGKETKQGIINIGLPLDLTQKFNVPVNASMECKLLWLAGYLDGDGCVAYNGDNASLQVISIHKKFLVNIQLMLQTMGIFSKIQFFKDECERLLPDGKGDMKLYKCKKLWRLLIASVGTYKLQELGMKCYRLKLNKNKPNRDARAFTTILKIKELKKTKNTYCFTESENNAGVFNGSLLGNCSEIVEYTDETNISVCNLASIALPKFIIGNSNKINEDTDPNSFNSRDYYDYKLFGEVVEFVVEMCDRNIDINKYPVEASECTNLDHRPIGVGVQGLADTFQKIGLAWEDEITKIFNEDIFSVMYYHAVKKSVELAKIYGSYKYFAGSPASQGLFQFDLQGKKPNTRIVSQKMWDDLRIDMIKYGLRNSLLLALMPTATTSQILGNNECIEPYTSNSYARDTLAGNFYVINKHLRKDLNELKLNGNDISKRLTKSKGSIQSFPELSPRLKCVYKTVWEIPQKVIMDLASDRGIYIDQTQSLNLHFEQATAAKLSSCAMYGFKKRLKTISYYIRSKAVFDAINFGDIDDVVGEKIGEVKGDKENEMKESKEMREVKNNEQKMDKSEDKVDKNNNGKVKGKKINRVVNPDNCEFCSA